MTHLATFGLAATLFGAPPVPLQDAADPAPRRPNLLVLVGDDHAASALGCAGHPFVETPALDRLAAEGVRFTNAFATTALCSPARASLLTGRYARQHGVLDDATHFPTDLPTFLSILGDAGYATGFVGKWHMGAIGWSRPELDFCATFEGPGEYRDVTFEVDGQKRAQPGFVDDAIASFALEFLEERRERPEPFVLTVAFRAAGSPREPRDELAGRYAEAELPWPDSVTAVPPYPTNAEYRGLVKARQAKAHRMKIAEHWAFGRPRMPLDHKEPYLAGRGQRSEYFELVTGLDESVGQVLSGLDVFGLRADTIVVYLSDHGILLGEHSLGGSGPAYEESMRIPWIVSHPGIDRSGVVVDELVLNVDLLPTLCSWAGVPVPEDVAGDVAGRSLAPLVAGADVEWRAGFVYEYWREGRWANVPDHVAYRTRDWKLVEYPEYPGWRQLFDLRTDPGELENLAPLAEQVDRLLELRRRLSEAEDAIGPRRG